MEEKPPMQKQSFAYILGWSQEKIAGQNRNLVNAITLLYTTINSPEVLADVRTCLCLLLRLYVQASGCGKSLLYNKGIYQGRMAHLPFFSAQFQPPGCYICIRAALQHQAEPIEQSKGLK